jgi:hypothetical protein
MEKFYFFGINGAYFWRSYSQDDIDGSMVSSIYYIEKGLAENCKILRKRCLNFGQYLSQNETRRFIRKKRRLNQISNVLRIMKYTDEQIARYR